MSEDVAAALRDLRDALRSPVDDTDAFAFLLSSTLQTLGLHPTSVSLKADSTATKAIDRYLPAIQLSLLSTCIPTFLASLDSAQSDLLKTFFVPTRNAERSSLAVRRQIALCSYLNLVPLLSAKNSQQSPLPLAGREYLLDILGALAQTYGIDELYWAVWAAQSDHAEGSRDAGARELQWEEAIKAVVGLPAKVANAVGRWKADGWNGDAPETLVPKHYFDNLMCKLESLMYELSHSTTGTHDRIQNLLGRLAANGMFNPRPSRDSRSPSFWTPILPPLLDRLHPAPSSPLLGYADGFLAKLFLGVPPSALRACIESLLHHLIDRIPHSELKPDKPNEYIRRATECLQLIIGPARDGGEAVEAVTQAVLGLKPAQAMEGKRHALLRIVTAWLSLSGEKVTTAFLDDLAASWTDPKYTKYTMYAQQFSLTHALILVVSSIPPFHPRLVALSHQGRFLAAMQTYLSHPDPSIRRLGLLVAEVLSERTIPEPADGSSRSAEDDDIEQLRAGLEGDGDPERPKRKPKATRRLNFGSGMWDGEGEGRSEVRWLRSAIEVEDASAPLSGDHEMWLLGWRRTLESTPPNVIESPRGRRRFAKPKAKAAKPTTRPKIVMLDDEQRDDTLSGYIDQSPSSSRSPSPTPSFLDEVTADPSLALDATSRNTLNRPVYMSQLLTLIKEREKPDHIEMALKWGEALIRAKRAFGTELEEHAQSLATMAVALNDPFNIEGFDERRQGILNALVACSPRNVGPLLSEIYFTGQWSLHQRAVILTALSMGARELAGLPIPSVPSTKKIDFPSKVLPPALHRKYIGPNDARQPDQIEDAISGVRALLLSKGARKGEEVLPEMAREKRLRVGTTKRNKVAEVGTLAARQMADKAQHDPVVPFKDIAADCFIMPLINRFWQHFQDATTRESRAALSGDRYRGAGTGMILSPMALEKFLMTLSLLIHAARHSSLFLTVICPESIELAVTTGLRHLTRPQEHMLGEEGDHKEGGVIAAALEICLIALDAAYDLDGGRTIAMDKASLLMGAGEWASGIFEAEERGGEVAAGQGGLREGRVRACAAGVVVKVSEIEERWGRMRVM